MLSAWATVRPQSQVRYKARLLRFFLFYGWLASDNFIGLRDLLRGVSVVFRHETSMTWLLAPAPALGVGVRRRGLET